MLDLSFQPLVWSGYVLDGQRRGPLKVRVRSSVAGGDLSRTYISNGSVVWVEGGGRYGSNHSGGSL